MCIRGVDGMNKIKNLKITKNILKYSGSYVLVAGVSFGLLNAVHLNPFKKDSREVSLLIKTECDSDGVNKDTKSYKFKTNDLKNTATFVGAWQKDDNGYYARDINEYELKDDVSKKEIEEVVTSSNAPYLLDTISRKKSTHKEEKYTISDYEAGKNPYASATIYRVDKKDYVIEKETDDENKKSTQAFFVLNILADLFATGLFKVDEMYEKKKVKRK